MGQKLTALKVQNAKPKRNDKGELVRTELPDGGCAGLYLVIQPNGKRSWSVRYRRKADKLSRKITLDGSLSLAAARSQASDYLEQVAKGKDPAAAIQIENQAAQARAVGGGDTFAHVVRNFILRDQRRKRDNKPHGNRTWKETARLLGLKPTADNHNTLEAIKGGIADRWGSRTFSEIQKRDILAELDAIVDRGSGIMSNRTLAAVRRLFNWAVGRDIISVSPCEGVKPPVGESKRDRVLTNDEIKRLWKACDIIGQPFGHAVKLLLLTGQRRSEVGEMTDGEIDDDRRLWTIPANRTKNNVVHDVPLSDQAIAVLESLKRISGKQGFIFTTTGINPASGWSKVQDSLRELVGSAEHWQVHDIRRTVATGMQRLGIRLEVTEKTLNHTSGSLGGIAGVYQRHDFAVEKREALDKWAREVDRIVKGKTADVVRMAR